MAEYKIHKFPGSRIATFDVCEIGKRKHHVAAIIEIDVTVSREKIKRHKQVGRKISFTAWMIQAIGRTIKDHEHVAAYRQGRDKLVVFADVNVSLLVEKELNGQKVPIPLVIEKADERSMESIARQIAEARSEKISDGDIVLQKKSSRLEKLYYLLPGWVRRGFWRYLLKHPRQAFAKMGNVAITSVGMMGNVKGWFIPIAVHPVCFGISAITRKPAAVDDRVEIREILNISVLIDHDVVDGADMVRFLSDLSGNMESGIGL